ncbi:WXG100 family type VII secretion target [Amycolatopsis sp. NPDC004368]
MSAGRFDFTDADEILDRMGKTTGGIRAVLAELESTVERDMAGWTPEAQARYWSAKRAWTDAVDRMPGCVARAREAFREIAGKSAAGSCGVCSQP